MKSVLFSLCILLICILFCRYVFNNNAAISSEAMISYISENFTTTDTIADMLTMVTRLTEGLEKIVRDDAIRGFFDNYNTSNDPMTQISNTGNILDLLVGILEILYNIVFFAVYGFITIVGLIWYGAPLVLSIIRDSFSILKLISYVLFGTAI